MPLTSRLFRGSKRLQACLVDDQAHLTPGTKGDFVILVQQALDALDEAGIAPAEIVAGTYGPTTAAAVLDYKTKRKIINKSYQTKPDNIVGKMTIKALDDELVSKENAPAPIQDDRCPFLYPAAPKEQAPAPAASKPPSKLIAPVLRMPSSIRR